MQYGKFIDATDILSFQLRFLSKATTDDERHYFMKYIHIEPSDKGEGLLGVTTDGARLHLVDPINDAAVKVFGLSQGYWQVFKGGGSNRLWIARLEDSETNGFQFANWRRIMPSGEPEYKTTFSGFSFKKTGFYTGYPNLAKFLHEFPKATALNLGFIQDLGTGFDWHVDWYGPNKPLKFTEGDRVTVIMPMTID